MKTTNTEEQISILSSKLKTNNLVLVAGAGLSRLAEHKIHKDKKMPLWRDLMVDVAKIYNISDKITASTSALEVFDYIESNFGRNELEQKIRVALNAELFEPSSAHSALLSMPFKYITTTNYDDLLSRYCDNPPIVNENDYERLSIGEKSTIHLHGDLYDQHTLTNKDYQGWAQKRSTACNFLTNLMVNSHFLFIGYSLSDPHILNILNVARNTSKRQAKKFHAFIYNPDIFKLESWRTAYNIEVVPYTSESELEGLIMQLSDEVNLVPNESAHIDTTWQKKYYAFLNEVNNAIDSRTIGGITKSRSLLDVKLEHVFIEPDVFKHSSESHIEQKVNEFQTKDFDKFSSYINDEAIDKSIPLGEYLKYSETEKYAEHFSGSERVPAFSVINKSHAVILLGEPGQGKSTLLKMFIRHHFSCNGPYFPIHLKLAKLNSRSSILDGNLMSYTISQLAGNFSISPNDLKFIIEHCKVVWLLDGFDEIRGEEIREKVCDDIALLKTTRPTDRFVISSRISDAPRLLFSSGWTILNLAPLTQSQSTEIIDKWQLQISNHLNFSIDIKAMLTESSGNIGVRDLRSNPLFLTFIILFINDFRELPKDKWEFYAKVTDSFFNEVERHYNDSELPDFSLEGFLSKVASYGCQTNQVIFSKTEIDQLLDDYLQANDFSKVSISKERKKFYKICKSHLGIFSEKEDNGLEKAFSFIHLTFQEYLCALSINRACEKAVSLFRQFGDEQSWYEIWTLYFASIKNDFYMVQCILAVAKEKGTIKVSSSRFELALLLSIEFGNTEADCALINAAYQEFRKVKKTYELEKLSYKIQRLLNILSKTDFTRTKLFDYIVNHCPFPLDESDCLKSIKSSLKNKKAMNFFLSRIAKKNQLFNRNLAEMLCDFIFNKDVFDVFIESLYHLDVDNDTKLKFFYKLIPNFHVKNHLRQLNTQNISNHHFRLFVYLSHVFKDGLGFDYNAYINDYSVSDTKLYSEVSQQIKLNDTNEQLNIDMMKTFLDNEHNFNLKVVLICAIHTKGELCFRVRTHLFEMLSIAKTEFMINIVTDFIFDEHHTDEFSKLILSKIYLFTDYKILLLINRLELSNVTEAARKKLITQFCKVITNTASELICHFEKAAVKLLDYKMDSDCLIPILISTRSSDVKKRVLENAIAHDNFYQLLFLISSNEKLLFDTLISSVSIIKGNLNKEEYDKFLYCICNSQYEHVRALSFYFFETSFAELGGLEGAFDFISKSGETGFTMFLYNFDRLISKDDILSAVYFVINYLPQDLCFMMAELLVKNKKITNTSEQEATIDFMHCEYFEKYLDLDYKLLFTNVFEKILCNRADEREIFNLLLFYYYGLIELDTKGHQIVKHVSKGNYSQSIAKIAHSINGLTSQNNENLLVNEIKNNSNIKASEFLAFDFYLKLNDE
ncbi:SIR2 family protein [Pseudoalteromonas aurantia]|uniref:NACHT domain-containing protein n=1 Tax=Pseudoalteromonas aurantia 208 TaxID=1314867 RepID=A0ABR9EI03_9GAMM|nr:SIR2 family protein [Pseudoalteromonas aurantia]MBE0370367.1 hypothetical protein [Pseudoalteromonas aurantia 208]